MEFTIPTTKNELYQTLKDLFNHYRLPKIPFEEIQLLPLTLERDEYPTLTDSELETKAYQLLEGKYLKEKSEKQNVLITQKDELEAKQLSLLAVKNSKIEQANEKYDLAIEKVKIEAKKNGLYSSTITIEKLAFLESERANMLAEIEQNYLDENSVISASVQTLENKIDQVETYYQTLLEKEVIVKKEELKREQEEILRDVFRYNNGLEEKEQKSANSILNAKATLKLKYAEINAHELTREELIELGYYTDVLKCVMQFYENAFSDDVSRYQDILNEANLVMYLEDYYSDVLLLFRSRAGM